MALTVSHVHPLEPHVIAVEDKTRNLAPVAAVAFFALTAILIRSVVFARASVTAWICLVCTIVDIHVGTGSYSEVKYVETNKLISLALQGFNIKETEMVSTRKKITFGAVFPATWRIAAALCRTLVAVDVCARVCESNRSIGALCMTTSRFRCAATGRVVAS